MPPLKIRKIKKKREKKEKEEKKRKGEKRKKEERTIVIKENGFFAAKLIINRLDHPNCMIWNLNRNT